MKKMEKAARAEAIFIATAFREGWEVAKPFHHAQGYDYVIRRSPEEGWKTVQVKATYQGKQGTGKLVEQVSLRRCNGRSNRPYKAGDFDFLFATDTVRGWLIPWKVIKDTRSIAQVGGKKFAPYLI